MGETPLVVACLAPDDLAMDVDPTNGDVTVDERRSALSAPDSAALEYALRVADAWGSKVLALAVGPPEIDGALLEARALGVEVRRIASRDDEHTPKGEDPPGLARFRVPGVSGGGRRALSAAEIAGDPSWTAAQLAIEIRRTASPAMVFCGDRSIRHGVGVVPGLLAAELGLPHVSGLVYLEVSEDETLLVERRLDEGWRERLSVNRPAVMSVEAAGVRLRRAGLGALAALANTPTATVPVTAQPSRYHVRFGTPVPYRPRTQRIDPPAGDAHERLVAITGSQRLEVANRVVGPLSPAEAADELVAYLSQHGYLG